MTRTGWVARCTILLAVLCGGCGSDADNVRIESVDDQTVVVEPTATVLPPVVDAQVDAEVDAEVDEEPSPAAAAPEVLEEDRFSFVYAVAAARPDDSQIPVYDEPGGERRTLLYVNDVDGVQLPNPLFAQTWFGNPLVLRVVESRADGWLKVQVPTRPNQSHVWVEAADFVVRSTDVWIEATTSPSARSDAGELVVYRGSEPIFTAVVASGKDSRPTPMVTGWVGQWLEGASLSPAYGSWVVDLGTYSDALGTFGGGGLPLMVLHGTNQPELIGIRVTSGAFRLRNEELDELVAIDGLLGAPVHIHDRPLGTVGPQSFRGTSPAITTTWAPEATQLTSSAL